MRFNFIFVRLGTVFQTAALLLLAVSGVHAQTGLPTSDQPTSEPSATPFVYKSAFEGFQAYTEEKTANWKEANDTTARIGGWRAYAKEAAQPAVTPAPAPVPATPTTPVKP